MKKVGIVMGSDSDLPILRKAMDTLDSLGIPFEAHVYSAHRTPEQARHFALHARENGFGAMISFNVDSNERLLRVLERVQLITFAESLGGAESLITYPLVQTHGSIPAQIRDELGISETLLRLSVGLEDADDLIADLAQALA